MMLTVPYSIFVGTQINLLNFSYFFLTKISKIQELQKMGVVAVNGGKGQESPGSIRWCWWPTVKRCRVPEHLW